MVMRHMFGMMAGTGIALAGLGVYRRSGLPQETAAVVQRAVLPAVVEYASAAPPAPVPVPAPMPAETAPAGCGCSLAPPPTETTKPAPPSEPETEVETEPAAQTLQAMQAAFGMQMLAARALMQPTPRALGVPGVGPVQVFVGAGAAGPVTVHAGGVTVHVAGAEP